MRYAMLREPGAELGGEVGRPRYRSVGAADAGPERAPTPTLAAFPRFVLLVVLTSISLAASRILKLGRNFASRTLNDAVRVASLRFWEQLRVGLGALLDWPSDREGELYSLLDIVIGQLEAMAL